MTENEKQALFQNTPKMRAMVDGVAHFLAALLQVRDSEVDAKYPFVEIVRRELHYFQALTGDGSFENMNALMKMYEFVQRAEDLSQRMRVYATQAKGSNIDISPFTLEECYYGGDQLICEGAVRTAIDVGDLGHRLQKELQSLIPAWLDELDKVLCECSGISPTHNGTRDDGLVAVKGYLSYAIAQRITMMSYESVVDDCLSSRALEELLNEVYQESKIYAGESKDRDAFLVKMLLVLAKDPRGEETQRFLTGNLDDLRELTRSPPSEIDRRRGILGLERVARAFAPDLDLGVRVAMVAFWSENTCHAPTALQAALKEILDWQPLEKVVKIHSILAREGSGRICPDLMIPPMSFLYSPRCFACKQPERRSGLPEGAARAECLIRAVWELASRGVFVGGIIAADVVCPVAMDSILMSRMAAKSITNERDVNKLGFKMHAFVQRLYNREGDHDGKIGQASCHLSHFSCRELETVFDTNNPGLVFLCRTLTSRTRSLMTYCPDPEYTSFATDTLAVVLPLIYQRRNRLGIPTRLRSNAFLDLLRTIPRVLHWHPTKGALQLSLEDLRGAHESCADVFDQLHAKGVMVSRTGFRTTSKHAPRDNRRKVVYTLDTFQLWNILTDHSALFPL